jgi:uncharacterized SAM-binding protein YcdF (DUF218 family)
MGAGLLAAAGLFVARERLLAGAGRLLIDAAAPAPADAIVVLAGSVPDRILEAAALYHEARAPRVVLSREPDSAAFRQMRALGVRVPSRQEISRTAAEQLGIPPAAIAEVGGEAGSTLTEARVLLTYVRARGYRRILLVTSKTHTRRAALIHRDLAGGLVEILPCPSRYDDFDPARWWRHRAWRRRVVIEYQKLLAYVFLDRWRVTPLNH